MRFFVCMTSWLVPFMAGWFLLKKIQAIFFGVGTQIDLGDVFFPYKSHQFDHCHRCKRMGFFDQMELLFWSMQLRKKDWVKFRFATK